MPKARKEQLDLSATPYYHCISRCVRRAFLCGTDQTSGQSYDHRKQWLVDRMKLLTQVFAIEVCAYAIMSNHYHLVLRVDEDRLKAWDEEEVVQRWSKLFVNPRNPDLSQYRQYKNRVYKPEEIRDRLTSISWFMRCMNETIAKQANREDDCTGRFWEGRFRSQALLDEGALLTCMVYVDLNPIRAGIAETPEDSDFTSLQERILQYWQRTHQKPKKVAQWQQQNESSPGQGLMKLATTDFEHPDRLPFSREEYLELVEWSGKQWRQGKKGKIPDHLQPILKRLELNEGQWLETLKQFRYRFFHAVGKGPRLSDFAQKLERQHWLRGKQAAARMYRTAA